MSDLLLWIDPEYQARQLKANERSIELLRSWLTPQQLADFDARQRFVVRGSETGERYLITSAAQPYNVVQLDDRDKGILRLCFQPGGDVRTVGDIMLAQKIMLETDELEARAISNRQTPNDAYFRSYPLP